MILFNINAIVYHKYQLCHRDSIFSILSNPKLQIIPNLIHMIINTSIFLNFFLISHLPSILTIPLFNILITFIEFLTFFNNFMQIKLNLIYLLYLFIHFLYLLLYFMYFLFTLFILLLVFYGPVLVFYLRVGWMLGVGWM